ncbi:MAG: AAA family ATPase [Bacteroidaceae bacterium]|nr:AAA family ATPase [Bacteroidaceae bacterium]
MTAKELFQAVFGKAKEYGLTAKNDRRTIIDPKGNAVIRENLESQAFSDGSAFFAFIRSEEEPAGQYSDFSFVVFPDSKEYVNHCVVCLGVGSSGFRNDYQLASLPGLRRLFLKLKTDRTYFKTSFEDIESSSSDLLGEIKANFPLLRAVLESYKTVLPASQIVCLDNEEKALDTIFMWLATYAKMRAWGTAAQKKVIETQLERLPQPPLPDDEKEVNRLLEKRKYIVLQGAPGTGKTYTALKVAEKYDKVFFEQFHAETNYSDFVYGLEPDTTQTSTQLKFRAKEGILYQAIKYAQEHSREEVLLIIDEINRANLSNVLGPVFYLFEYQPGARKVKTKVGDLELHKLPDNIKVVATMNTADRSLAVVDFALRRRFAWYTLRPHEIKVGDGKFFMKRIYNQFADIFFEYATDDELNLQPGQSYFIVEKANKDEEMKERMVYELMPLIKEYLAEGYLLKAKDSFCDLFLKETGRLMYE